MKTRLFFAAAAVAVISLSSCKKDYTCECDWEYMGQSTTATTEINDAKKKDAEEACDSFETQTESAGGSASCTLSEK